MPPEQKMPGAIVYDGSKQPEVYTLRRCVALALQRFWHVSLLLATTQQLRGRSFLDSFRYPKHTQYVQPGQSPVATLYSPNSAQSRSLSMRLEKKTTKPVFVRTAPLLRAVRELHLLRLRGVVGFDLRQAPSHVPLGVAALVLRMCLAEMLVLLLPRLLLAG